MNRRQRHRLWFSLLIALVIGGGLTLAHRNPWLLTVNQTSHDLFFRRQDPERFGNYPRRVVIVALDDRSLERLGRWSGWDRGYYARVIDTLAAANARVIALDVGFIEPGPGDDELARAIRAARIVVQPVVGVFAEREADDARPALRRVEEPAAHLRPGTARFGSVNVTPDRDGVVRTLPLVVDTERGPLPSLALATLATYLLPDPDLDQPPPSFYYAGRDIPITPGHRFRVNYVGAPSHVDGPQAFRLVSFVDVLEGRVPAAVFDDKIVFIGLLGASGFADDYWTPVSNEQDGKMAGVEIHANATITLAASAFLVPEDLVVTAVTTMLLAILAALVSARLGIFRALLAVAGVALGYWLLAGQMFDRGQLVNVIYPELALLLPYVATTIYRLVFEERHSRFLRGAMGRYLSPAVLDAIVRQPELMRLGGEKREMTVLFSDIRGFTSLAERLDPQELVALLNEYLTAMTAVVYRHDGVLDKYMGDAIMAFWNSPVDQPDHPRRACLTALEMIEELTRLNERWLARGVPPLNIGVGINTGPMSVGNMGSETRFDYTVLGDAVNLASRLEGLNKEYYTNIVVSENTLLAVRAEGFVVRFLDLVAVKGKHEPVGIYELLGIAGHYGSLTPELLTTYERAMQLYRAQEFREAAEAFRAVLDERPGDGPSTIYLARCTELLSSPPPRDWDGVFVMTHK